MIRTLLLGLALATCAAAQDPGLPGPPVLPPRPLQPLPVDPGPFPEHLGPQQSDVDYVAERERSAVSALAAYLTKLFVEDSQLDVDGRLQWAGSADAPRGGGVRLRFKTQLLEAEVDQGYYGNAMGGVKLKFADLVGERFSVRASVDRSYLELDEGTARSRFDNHALGVALGDATELEFEVFLRKDEAVGSYRDSYRAIVKHQIGETVFKIGLDRSYNGAPFENGELNGVVGVELPPLTLRSKRHYLELTTSVEVMYGRTDDLAPGVKDTQTLGIAPSLGLEVGANDGRWVAGVGGFHEETRAGLSGSGIANRVTAQGVWLYGSWQVQDDRRLYANAKRTSLRTQLFGGDEEVTRSVIELGLETTTSRGQRWRMGLNAGAHDAPGGDGWTAGVTVGFSF
ncbi:MAG: hypothetical protein R3F62_16815 [Planctomycetota bacterium]